MIMDMNKIDSKVFLIAIYFYLDSYFWEGLDELGGFLGSLAPTIDGSPVDQALHEDWCDIINKQGNLGKEEAYYVSSSKPRVDTSRLFNTSHSLTGSSSNSSTLQLSKEAQKLSGKTNRYKKELFERPGKTKDQTSLRAAKIELQGQQIDLAIEKGVSFDHVSKVKAAQRGLLKHLDDINARLSHPELQMIEREALTTELSSASKLLDYTEQFVPRKINTSHPTQVPKPKAP